jgi:hypothetical protein
MLKWFQRSKVPENNKTETESLELIAKREAILKRLKDEGKWIGSPKFRYISSCATDVAGGKKCQ